MNPTPKRASSRRREIVLLDQDVVLIAFQRLEDRVPNGPDDARRSGEARLLAERERLVARPHRLRKVGDRTVIVVDGDADRGRDDVRIRLRNDGEERRILERDVRQPLEVATRMRRCSVRQSVSRAPRDASSLRLQRRDRPPVDLTIAPEVGVVDHVDGKEVDPEDAALALVHREKLSANDVLRLHAKLVARAPPKVRPAFDWRAPPQAPRIA